MIIRENQLDDWVRGNKFDARTTIVELVWRLVCASTPTPQRRHFPMMDGTAGHGPDGELETDQPRPPWVPPDRSFWQIGTGQAAAAKATDDYTKFTKETPMNVRQETAFIFVTPLSGVHDWEYTWKKDEQLNWLQTRRDSKEWRQVEVFDGTVLEDWMRAFPAVSRWMAGRMNLPVAAIDAPEQWWDVRREIGKPPLTPEIFLVGRETAKSKLEEFLKGNQNRLKLEAKMSGDVVDFISAYVAILERDRRVETGGRILFARTPEAWENLVHLHDPHTLVALFNIDDPNIDAPQLITKATQNRHAVIETGHGGIYHHNVAPLPNPTVPQLKDALVKSGYSEAKAHGLAQKTGGNLAAFVRLIHNASAMPEWVQTSPKAELVVAELLGSWKDDNPADQKTAEAASGKAYGEWIGKIREVAARPDAPLGIRNGAWKFTARYEAWTALGPSVLDADLDRFERVAQDVLSEEDPQFELPPEERYLARVKKKIPWHSTSLRRGVAETLALLASYPSMLSASSAGKPERTAALVVRHVLQDRSWKTWASLNHEHPLLAEAAPDQFLDGVENALQQPDAPLAELFAQERSGAMGTTYMSGLLWALETLAWHPDHLARVTSLLGFLDAIDPGGNWSNRPGHSLTTIFLPWFPQTTAPVARRVAAIKGLLAEHPATAWKLLLSLLPSGHQVSSGSHRPIWRELIPTEVPDQVPMKEYREQIQHYTELAIELAVKDREKLVKLLDHLDDLPTESRERILEHLSSPAVTSLREPERLPIWNQLVDLASRHHKFKDAAWAMKSETVLKIEAAADALRPTEPSYVHQRLFSPRDHDFFDERGNYEAQREALHERRAEATMDVFKQGGIELMHRFVQNVQSPGILGYSFASQAPTEADGAILPGFLGDTHANVRQFASAYAFGRFEKVGWSWVDGLSIEKWSPTTRAALLIALPFRAEVWEHVPAVLGDQEDLYWKQVEVNPYLPKRGLEHAIDQLLQYGRAGAAVSCLMRTVHNKEPLDAAQTIRALQAFGANDERNGDSDASAISEIIKKLQHDPSVDKNDLLAVELKFLEILDDRRDGRPKTWEEALTQKPDLFVDLIRRVYRPKGSKPQEKLTDDEKRAAQNCYRILHAWKRPPGLAEEGQFDGDAFKSWWTKAEQDLQESGHYDVGAHTFGEVLIYVPADPDGLWIHRAAAEVLNGKEAEPMRDGFTTGSFNARGVHGYTAGAAEREIAKQYHQQADAADLAGYARLADAVRQFAKRYEQDADREASGPPFGE